MYPSTIPSRCPKCGSESGWKEVVNPFTTGIPLLGGRIRLSLIVTRGFRFLRVTYRCDDCQYSGKYTL